MNDSYCIKHTEYFSQEVNSNERCPWCYVEQLRAELAKEREEKESTHAELLAIHTIMMCVEEECVKDGSNDTMTISLVRNYLRHSQQELKAAEAQVAALVILYDKYLEFLNKANDGPVTIAYVHGWRCPENIVEQGERFRKEIELAKAAAPLHIGV